MTTCIVFAVLASIIGWPHRLTWLLMQGISLVIGWLFLTAIIIAAFIFLTPLGGILVMILLALCVIAENTTKQTN